MIKNKYTLKTEKLILRTNFGSLHLEPFCLLSLVFWSCNFFRLEILSHSTFWVVEGSKGGAQALLLQGCLSENTFQPKICFQLEVVFNCEVPATVSDDCILPCI